MSINISLSGIIEHIHSPLVDCVLPAASRNYSSNVSCRSIARQICALYDDTGYIQVREFMLSISESFMIKIFLLLIAVYVSPLLF